MKKERTHAHDQAALHALRTEYVEQHSGHVSGALSAQWGVPDSAAPRSIGWPLWLAWIIVFLAFFPTAIVGIFIGLAALTPITLNITLLEIVLLVPVAGGALALLAVIFALLATRRARRGGAGVAAPITLVWLATAILVAGLLFGGLVAYPRYQLGAFGQALQAHCARLGQTLQPYQSLSVPQLLAQAPTLVATLQSDATSLPGDQTVLNALAPPEPKYQPLLDDCRLVAMKDQQVVSDLQRELAALPPDPTAAQATLQHYQSDTYQPLTEIHQLGDELKQEVFAPFQPG